VRRLLDILQREDLIELCADDGNMTVG